METTESPSEFLEDNITTPDTISISDRRNIFGKIVNKKNQPIYLVEVKNLSNSSQNTTYTNSNGEFTIFASPEDKVRISKKGVGSKTINLTINDNYTLEDSIDYLPIILGVLGFIYVVITCVFIGIGSKLREKETNNYKRNTLLAFIILSVLGIPFQPVFLIVLIILCAIYHKELQEGNNSNVNNGNKTQFHRQKQIKVVNKKANQVNKNPIPLAHPVISHVNRNTIPFTNDVKLAQAYRINYPNNRKQQNKQIPQAHQINYPNYQRKQNIWSNQI